jgi:hypothetical protein
VGNPLSSRLVRERKAAKQDVWRQQCEVVQRLGRSRFEVGFTTEEGNEALIAAGLPTLNGEQMKWALKGRPNADTSPDHFFSPDTMAYLPPAPTHTSAKAASFQQQENPQVTSDEQRKHERRWREILEELGPDVVRSRFGARMSVWGDRYREKLPPNDFVVAWLAEKYALSQRIDARRFFLVALMTFSTLIATCFTLIAAWIAAYPVLCRWLPDAWSSLKRLCG